VNAHALGLLNHGRIDSLRSSALRLLEELAILSSRACLFERSSRDLAAMVDAEQALRERFHSEPAGRKDVGRLSAQPLQDDCCLDTERKSG
jgi:hypothetical protein